MAKTKTNSRNPSSNSILQALLDLADCGYGTMSVDDLITKLSSDSKLRTSLQKRWDRHAYPDESITWVQLTTRQEIFTLSDEARTLLQAMGTYANQSGLIQISTDNLVKLTHIKRTPLRAARTELLEAKAIAIVIPHAQHEPPVYAVNQRLINKGSRASIRRNDKFFEGDMSDSVLSRKLDLIVKTEVIRSADKPAYNRVYLVSAPDDPAEGRQMTITDFPEAMPDE